MLFKFVKIDLSGQWELQSSVIANITNTLGKYRLEEID